MSDAIVGYYWTSESGHRSAFYCVTHRPTPPDDGEPVYEGDATDETCEDCGAPLCPTHARSASTKPNADSSEGSPRGERE